MQEIVKRQLGKTDIEVTPIGLGAMEFAGGRGFFKFMLGPVEPEVQDEVIKVALDSGMNLIDTAEIYGSGYSECSVSRGLQAAGQTPGDVVITTKWFPMMKRAKSMRKSVAKSTERLSPYPIDLYLVHMPFSVSSVKTQMDEMADLVESGMISAVGISNFSKDRMIKAHEALAERGIPLATNQGFANFTPKECTDSKYLAYCLQFYTPQISQLAGSTTFKEVSRSSIKKFKIPGCPECIIVSFSFNHRINVFLCILSSLVFQTIPFRVMCCCVEHFFFVANLICQIIQSIFSGNCYCPLCLPAF